MDAVDARLATLMPLTPAPKRDVGGSVHRSEVYGRRLYLVILVVGKLDTVILTEKYPIYLLTFHESHVNNGM